MCVYISVFVFVYKYNIIEIEINTYLFSKRGGRGNLEGFEEVIINGQAGLINKHASIEVKRGPGAQLRSGPVDPIRALLAVANSVLGTVTPSFLTETIHHCIKIPIWQVKEVINVLIYLYIPIQVYHLAVLHKLHTKIVKLCLVYVHLEIKLLLL